MRISDWSSDVCSSDLDQTQYFASGSYMDQEGAIIGSGFSRGSFRLNLDQKVGERLSFSSQLYVSRSKADRSATEVFGGSLLYSALSMPPRSEEHTSELQSLMRISYAVFCLKKKKKINN